MESIRTANPRYVGAPPNMADGRLFTDYRASCELAPSSKKNHSMSNSRAGFDRREQFIKNGEISMEEDRMFTTWVAGTVGRVDTMVPELNKRFCSKEGCKTFMGHQVGIGTGRLVVSPDLAAADPDVLALKATPALFGIFSSHLRGSHQNQRRGFEETNNYSAPYGKY